jgi:asparagine N-glycosylation enzyme membrane subunit Stt3
VTERDRGRSPKESRSAPPRLDRAEADAAAARELDGYLRQRSPRLQPRAGRRRSMRWWAVLPVAAAGGALGAWLGAPRGDTVGAAVVMALLCGLVAAVATRR